MPSRRLALLRTPKGPWVCTHGIRQPELQVTGVKTPVTIIVRQRGDEELETTIYVAKDSRFALMSSTWTSITVQGDCGSIICEIIARRAA